MSPARVLSPLSVRRPTPGGADPPVPEKWQPATATPPVIAPLTAAARKSLRSNRPGIPAFCRSPCFMSPTEPRSATPSPAIVPCHVLGDDRAAPNRGRAPSCRAIASKHNETAESCQEAAGPGSLVHRGHTPTGMDNLLRKVMGAGRNRKPGAGCRWDGV
ncbi:hypothetical protein GCM10015535_32970 [Streptomyces gelaticus]|uniref:Uncharacterized protein n=1 Tax=Streptomyces gelaticus TaxID=285446 RepID=A0ABQ2VYY3_9ACTN|nr:hypothetical protein GCM10015535_32970 [Streptomyces gelaticus]